MKFPVDRDTRRRWFDVFMSGAALVCVGLALLPLGSILMEAFVRGAPALTPNFLTQPSLLGGIANAIQGTFILIGLTSLVALPVGILTGIYLSEFGKGRIGVVVRFFVDVMTQTPSVVVGIFAYSFVLTLALSGLVPRTLVFSVISGTIALSTIMIPIVARTSEDALRLVPTSAREAALALGIPRYRTILRVVLPSCASALVTGGLLGIARIGGETAPLLLTLGSSREFFSGLDQPIAAMPTQVYQFAIAPSLAENQAAWGASLILVLLMLGISIASRAVIRLRAVKR
ncbi:MAG: phosphate ABC transporter permease PstA [Methanobacteriota archaeon]|nr:MAG: phosphate ABC transporter permease PstA [Euryarchaeota archaeon]